MPQQHAHCAWATTILKLIIFVACGACWVCLCCDNPPNSDRDNRIFIVRTDVNACDWTRGCTDTDRVCTASWLWEKNPLPHRGIEPASAAWRSDVLINWATSHLHLSASFNLTSPNFCRHKVTCVTNKSLVILTTIVFRTHITFAVDNILNSRDVG